MEDFEPRMHEIEKRLAEIDQLYAGGSIAKDPEMLEKIGRERASLQPIMATYNQWKSIHNEIEKSRLLMDDQDPELRALAHEEIAVLKATLSKTASMIRLLLIPKDPLDEKNVILEIRAGTGGDEAALFATELFRMYVKYAEAHRWKVEILSSNMTGVGGTKEVIAAIEGTGAYSRLKHESGVHRVQRIPATEGSGRIHTSTVTVAVLPEAEDVDVKIDEKELRIDVFRSSGPGGQSVNTTDSAVRVTHLPTGIVVTCQDEKSQHKNKAKALKVLRSRLLDQQRLEQDQARTAERRSQIGTGDRSERIRTYNFPQSRITDHRIGLTTHRIHEVIEGDLNEIINALLLEQQSEGLRSSVKRG